MVIFWETKAWKFTWLENGGACTTKRKRIKADSQGEEEHSWSLVVGTTQRAVVEGIAISYRSFSPVARDTHALRAGERKKQGNFRKETHEIDSRARFQRARDFTTLSLSLSLSLISVSCVEKSRPRGETPRRDAARRPERRGTKELEKWK
mgnify:CR=1 FL=1